MDEFLFRLPPDPALLAELRRALAAWLRQLDGIAEQEVIDLVLATHEAAANAIEHSEDAYGPAQVNAWVIDGVLTVEVRDSGSWKTEPPPSDERGRGLTLIENLVDQLRIKKNARGTTLRLVHPSVQKRASPRDDIAQT